MSMNTKYVQRYVDEVAAMKTALSKLSAFVGSLPAPDYDGMLPSLDDCPVTDVTYMLRRIREVEALAADMWEYRN